jgi:hypothetical protein
VKRASREVIAAAAVAAVAVSACSKRSTTYEAKVRLVRVENVRVDATAKATDVDVELEYVDCPGEQLEVLRGDAAFADCMKQYKNGEEVKVKIDHHWQADRVRWDWDVVEIGGCKRPPDADDISSFDTVQECEPIVANGVTEGFHCNRTPQKELLRKCPWFARH